MMNYVKVSDISFKPGFNVIRCAKLVTTIFNGKEIECANKRSLCRKGK